MTVLGIACSQIHLGTTLSTARICIQIHVSSITSAQGNTKEEPKLTALQLLKSLQTERVQMLAMTALLCL